MNHDLVDQISRLRDAGDVDASNALLVAHASDVIDTIRVKSNDYSLAMFYDDCLAAVLQGAPIVNVLATWNRFRSMANRAEPRETFLARVNDGHRRLNRLIHTPSRLFKSVDPALVYDVPMLLALIDDLTKEACQCDLGYGVSCSVHQRTRERVREAQQEALRRATPEVEPFSPVRP